MNCNDIKDMINIYIDDELEDEEKKLFEKHIEQCEDCKKELEEYKKIISMLQNLTDEEPPKGYCKRLHEKLIKVKEQSKVSHRLRWMKYSSVAAVLVLVISAIYISTINGGFRGGMPKNEIGISYDSNMSATEAPASPATEEKNKGGFVGTQMESANINTADKSPEGSDFKMMMKPAELVEKEIKIIKSANIIAQTESYDTFINDLISKVELLGGYLEQNNTNVSSVYGDRELKYGNLIIRLPQDKFYEFVNYLEGTSKVKQRNITETDVTKDYYEKDNQVKNLELQENQLRVLFEKAQTVQDMILIENELRRIRTEIDALNISLSNIDDRASMSTVALEVDEVLKANLTLSYRDSFWDRARNGLINTVNGIVRFCENILIWIISMSPILIPILIFIIVLVVIIKRKNRK